MHSYRHCWAFLLGVLGVPQGVLGFALGTSLSAVEEGDDRLRPAVSLTAAFSDDLVGKAHFFGKDFGQVTERTALLSLGYRFPVLGLSLVRATIGGVVMSEAVSVSGEGGTSDSSTNIGVLFGLSFGPPARKGMFLECAWDSHVFLAGLAGLFLTTGRKQMLSFGVGYGW